MRRQNNKELKCHSQSFSCTDELMNEFDLNSKNFEVISIDLKLKPKEIESSSINTRSKEIKKFLVAFNNVSNKIYKIEKKK